MLSLFPQLFFLAPLGYSLLRGALAALFFLGIWEQWPSARGVLTRLLVGLEALTGIALAIGFWTQPAAIAALILLAAWLFMPRIRPYPVSTILLAGAIAIAILVGGPGLFAFDLPL